MPRLTCAHCGLPILVPGPVRGELVYCCHGCLLVARIVGGPAGDSARAWLVLRLGVGAFLAMDVMMMALLLYTGTVEPAAEP